MRNVSIQTRLIGGFCLVAAVTASACISAYYYFLTQDYGERSGKELAAALQIQEMASREQRNRAMLIAVNLAEDSTVRSAVLSRDAAKADPVLAARARELDADYITVVDTDGVALSRIGPAEGGVRKTAHGDPVFMDPLFQHALSGGETSGYEPCDAGGVCVSAYSPVSGRRGVVGYVSVGIKVDDAMAGWIKDVSGTDFVLLRDGAVAASSMSGLGSEPSELERMMRAAGGGAAREKAAMRIDIRGRPYMFQAIPLKNVDGGELGLLFAGKDASGLEAAWKKSLRALVMITGFALLLAVAAGYALSVRQSRPLKMLLKRVREITRGELTGKITVRGSDEIGRLGAAFNEMSDSLAERDRLLRENADELRKNQEQIIQSGKLAAIGELASGVAHEIGNPLSAISGYAQMMRKGGLPDETVREYSAEIEKESGFIENIIQDLLDFARPSAEGPVMLDLGEVVDSACKTVGAHKAFGGITINRMQPDGPRSVFATRKEMQQVCLNLLMNAAQAMPGGGVIDVEIRSDEGWSVLTIGDRGAGVPDAIRGKIFDPFFTTKPPGVGTGLGLSICYRIVEKHGGTLTHGNRNGGGAEFIIRMPECKGGDAND